MSQCNVYAMVTAEKMSGVIGAGTPNITESNEQRTDFLCLRLLNDDSVRTSS